MKPDNYFNVCIVIDWLREGNRDTDKEKEKERNAQLSEHPFHSLALI